MEKIKQFIISDKGKDILMVIIVILVGLISFELGRLSKNENASSGVKIEYPNQQEASVVSSINDFEANFSQGTRNLPEISKINNSTDKKFFASTRGSKYYSIGCGAGKTIKQENRIYFNTKEEAENKGYELSSSCK